MSEQSKQQSSQLEQAPLLEPANVYMCPNCAGKLTFDISKGTLVCESCASEFPCDSFPELNEAGNFKRLQDWQLDDAPHVNDAKEFFEKITWIDDAVVEDSINVSQYSCQACGAIVGAFQASASLFCPYCGNNLFAISGKYFALPDKIIPFEVTEEEARTKFNVFVNEKQYLSKYFAPKLEHITAIYVPYRSYNFDTLYLAREYGIYEEKAGTGGKDFWYYRDKGKIISTTFENVMVDAASRMPDSYMDSIAPFDFKKSRSFHLGYVAGILLELPDETDDVAIERARQMVGEYLQKEYTPKTVEPAFPDMEHCDVISEKMNMDEHIELTENTIYSLPVWLLHYSYNGKDMLFAVNGESGKCIGNLPISKPKRIISNLARIVKGALISALLALIFTLHVLPQGLSIFAVSLALLFVFFAVPIIGLWIYFGDGINVGKMNSARKSLSADSSVAEKKIVDKWNERKKFPSVARANSWLESAAGAHGLDGGLFLPTDKAPSLNRKDSVENKSMRGSIVDSQLENNN